MNSEILSILDEIQPDWSLDMVIRFLFIRLAPCFQRDLQYFLASDEEKFRQYQQGFINRFPHIVCSTLADFYVDLFREFGIPAKKIAANSCSIPLFALVVEGEYGWYFLDPLNELFANQYGLRPYFFGVIPRYKTVRREYPELVSLPDEYIRFLDEKISIPPYLDSYFDDLHAQLANRNQAYQYFGVERCNSLDLREKKLELFDQKFINLGNVSGIYERAQLYRYLNDRLLNHSEKKGICVNIQNSFTNPHICYEIQTREGRILYEEEKKDGQYHLVRTI